MYHAKASQREAMARLKRQRLDEDGQDKVTASSIEKSSVEDVERPLKPNQPLKRSAGRRSLFVRSLPASASSESLAKLFSQYYPLRHATVVVDKATKQPKGFGFVTFADVEDAEKAQKEFDGAEYGGRKIKVEVAEPRHRPVNGESSASQSRITKPTFGRQNNPQPKLIVRNLPWTIKNEDQLCRLFMSYGKVKHVNLPKKGPGLSSGFAFVVLRGHKNAERALVGMNGREIDGRTLAVDWAVDKQSWQNAQQDDNENSDLGQRDESVKSEDRDNADIGEVRVSDGEAGAETSVQDSLASDYEGDEQDRIRDANPDQMAGLASSLFVRNLPFDVDDVILLRHFRAFGPVRYAKIVIDQATGRSRGTGFVTFHDQEDARSCLREAPRMLSSVGAQSEAGQDDIGSSRKRSVLEDSSVDRTGKFILDGRVLQISKAVDRTEAARLTFANAHFRNARDKDRRRLYLLSEGIVPPTSSLYEELSAFDIKIREDSAKQRQTLIRSNPTLHLSLTRVSVRNLPRSITSKTLKSIAREAVVGFAQDVKDGKRKQLSKEELTRGGDEMKAAERDRRAKGKGIVKQAKIVFEGRDGFKVTEDSGAGRSRGYGFIEYSSHRWALMGLRWLNGYAANPSADATKSTASSSSGPARKKRLIAEFAIENAQVVLRRQEREKKARERSRFVMQQKEKGEAPVTKKAWSQDQLMAKARKGAKRNRPAGSGNQSQESSVKDKDLKLLRESSEKAAKRQAIIGRKRLTRKVIRKPEVVCGS